MPHKQPQSRNVSSTKGQKKSGGRSESVSSSPLSDLEFDVVSVLYQKAKALEAYDKYLSDAEASPDVLEVLETIRKDDVRHVRMLRECIGDLGFSEGASENEEEIEA